MGGLSYYLIVFASRKLMYVILTLVSSTVDPQLSKLQILGSCDNNFLKVIIEKSSMSLVTLGVPERSASNSEHYYFAV